MTFEIVHAIIQTIRVKLIASKEQTFWAVRNNRGHRIYTVSKYITGECYTTPRANYGNKDSITGIT